MASEKAQRAFGPSAETKTHGSSPLTVRKKQFQSRVTRGVDILPSVDQRGQLARRFADIQAALIVDAGGIDNCAEARLQLIRTTAGLVILREDMDAKVCMGEPIDISSYVRVSGALRRCLSTLGLDRRARDITNSIDAYLADKRSQEVFDCRGVFDETENFEVSE